MKTKNPTSALYIDPNAGHIGDPNPKLIHIGDLEEGTRERIRVSEDHKTVIIFEADTVIIRCNATVSYQRPDPTGPFKIGLSSDANKCPEHKLYIKGSNIDQPKPVSAEVEPIPSGSSGYEGYCPKCHKIIKTNIQGNELGKHNCESDQPEPKQPEV